MWWRVRRVVQAEARDHTRGERELCQLRGKIGTSENKSERRRRHLTVTDTTQNFPVRRSFFHPKLTEAHDPSSPRDREP